MTLPLTLTLFLLLAGQPAAPLPSAVLSRYVQVLGGDQALRAVQTRITEGEFDNGRGLKTRYRIVEEAPNKRVTLIGVAAIGEDAGSGRGFDGTTGWDKNFIGTGLRTLEGRELADAAREADMLRPLHLFDDCATTAVTTTPDATIVSCDTRAGGRVAYQFDPTSGLLVAQTIDGGRRPGLRIAFDDYRTVGTLRLAFRTRIDVGGATITYQAHSIRHNQPIDQAIFTRPASE